MSDWDEDSEELRRNLLQVLRQLREEARERRQPAIEQARAWQVAMMRGLRPPDPRHVGRFRGEPGLETCEVAVGAQPGVPAGDVAARLQAFEDRLRRTLEALDGILPAGQALDADGLAAVIDLCAWAHAEWLRIHPFANGNGRTARFWANLIAMRYGVPSFVRLRPRPDDGYAAAASEAMAGRWQATVRVFRRMYREALRA